MIRLDDSLPALAERYLMCRDVCTDYANLLRARVRLFCEWFAATHLHLPTIADLDASTINEWLASAKDSRSPWTVSGYRRNILAVWLYAYQNNETDEPPLRLRRIRIPAAPIQAWTLAEIRLLDATAARLTGTYPPGVRRSTFWRAVIHAAYSTGLRRGDLLRLRRDRIASNGLVEISQHKTGQTVRCVLGPNVLSWIRQLVVTGDPRAFPWPYHVRTFTSHFYRLVKVAGIRSGSFRWLRRSAASYVERDQPGSATRLLGHRSSGLARRHYLDQSICGRMPPMPPRI